jgi:hypothetical protein
MVFHWMFPPLELLTFSKIQMGQVARPGIGNRHTPSNEQSASFRSVSALQPNVTPFNF